MSARTSIKPTHRSQGFALIELIIVVVIVGVIGFAVWRVTQAQQTASTENTTQSQQANTMTEPKIENAKGLTAVETKLEAAELDDKALDELDTALDF
ncbi:prepilin-type N-terminal cleavage/methylation domain-containing protein [Candidatus Saccharibacteria bacterium]|nr:prepilin-type N-terminal cleavage/methylation domain-containing protein [Candidatus Saccharibacteria bacterium]